MTIGLLKSNFQLNTKRLIIRSYKKNDYKEWKRAYSSLEKKKNKWDFNPVSLDDEKKLTSHFSNLLLHNKKNSSQDYKYHFGIFEKKSGNLVGVTMIMDITRNIFQNANIGYHVLNPYWGKGYGKEIARGTLKIAFSYLSLHRVEAAIDPHNIRSIKMVKNVGFRKEGRSRNRLFLHGRWKDMMIYAITKEDKIL
ncbi:MAG: GNAT family N-acetyltransferase [Halobacteriovoraceae bacterium]|jgi:[ribosomal protein S5]-alanine N-acetyltransferase|nr:GNAT family N-acetyltransferase [Halobacteriovoraceae bacterium]